MKVTVLVLGLALVAANDAAAEQPDRSRFMGTPIYSSDGAEVGTITDVSLDEAGALRAIRVEAGTRLGFGVRTVEIPGRAVTIVRGVAVLGVPKEAIELLPSVDAQGMSDD